MRTCPPQPNVVYYPHYHNGPEEPLTLLTQRIQGVDRDAGSCWKALERQSRVTQGALDAESGARAARPLLFT